jgi:zinc transporter 11
MASKNEEKDPEADKEPLGTDTFEEKVSKWKSWKRIVLLIIAITVHNIPEGLAIGVSFGSLSQHQNETVIAPAYNQSFVKSRNLALAIGIQNMPEGMAVSVPMMTAGFTPMKSFFWGQFSGMVEPIFALLGGLVAVVAKPILSYALAFGAGAMVYVVFDDLLPEATQRGNVRISTWGGMIGFVIMMGLEAGLNLE